ncbi:efflux RND transporter permease subunit [Bryobacter aggregatus]|uniref:efflux RND transporter permease subunit n=1 Tax=Bryobacter aggregatus TaxID=360054 RepID=UPI0006906101|nr:CusA/CzcA family heavy metal efflux RND transporter [Bryobacter aggregatus]
MLSALIRACFDNRWLVLIALVLVSGAGLYVVSDLQVDAFPDLTNNQVTVITEAGPMSPRDVEQLVTYPIETALMGVPKMMELRSISKLGLSLITVVMDDSVDRYFARQLLNERLREVRSRLPQGVEPVLGPVATAFGEIYQYTIEGGDLSLLDRKTFQDWVIRPQLRTVPGINEVNSWGGYSKQYTVEVDPQALARYGLTVRDVLSRLSLSNANFGGGFIEHQAEQYNVLGMGRFQSPSDIEKVVLIERGGTPVKVSDVAVIRVEGALRQGAVLRNTQETVCGMAIMLRGENSQDVIERVKKRLTALPLPAGVKLVPFYDQSDVIAITIETVKRNLLEAGLLVSVILFLFLGDLRSALIVASVIPFAMLFGFMGMAFWGVSANLMSLGAIDFGMIVDGAVVMMENIIRRLHLDHGARPRAEVIRESAQEVAKPILFGVLIIMAVYLPILFLQDLEGRMFRPMAISVVSALFGSLLLALFAVPVLASLLLGKKVEEKEPAWFLAIQRMYRSSLRGAIRFRWGTVALALLVLSGAFTSIAFLGSEFMPRLDEGMIVVQTKKLPGISVPLSVDASRQVERILLSFPEVASVTTKLGRPDVATEAMGVYEADVYVNLKAEKRWLKPHEREQLIEAMDKALQEMPGMEFNFTMPMAMRLEETVSGVKADVALKIFGEDTSTLERLAAQAEKALTGLNGIADLQTEVITGVAEMRVTPDRNALARYGLTIEDLQSAVDATSGGIPVSEFVEGQRRFPIMLRYPANYRADIGKIGDIFVKAPAGEQVWLRDVAKIEEGRGAEIIQRENGMKRIVTQFNVRGRDLGSVVADAQAKLKQAVQFPAGYTVEWGGQFENQARATRRLALVLPLSVLLILSLLYATFRSLSQSLLIFCAVPFSAIGGIGMLWLRGMNLNLSAAVGFIALFGVAVLNGIVMVTTINQLRDVEEGAVQRLRPVLMTALVAAFGFLPMAFSTMPGSEVQRPLASVVVGGLFSATLLTLYLLPVLYQLFISVKTPAQED